MMFWVFLLSVFGSIAVYTNRERHRELIPYVVAVIAVTEMFFLLLMVVHNNPFSTFLTPPPPTGRGSTRCSRTSTWRSTRRRSTPGWWR